MRPGVSLYSTIRACLSHACKEIAARIYRQTSQLSWPIADLVFGPLLADVAKARLQDGNCCKSCGFGAQHSWPATGRDGAVLKGQF